MTKLELCLLQSGDKVSISGYYVYNGHVNPSQYENCFVTNKAKMGLYLSKGSIVPFSGSCNHQIEWRLDK